MLWQVEEKPVGIAQLGNLLPERVLFDFDGPRSYVTRDLDGELLFLHQCGESDEIWRYFVVPFSEPLLAELEGGRIDLHTALDQPRLWIADIGRVGVKSLYQVQLRKNVSEYFPCPGTMLSPELEPLLSVRSIGQNVSLGRVTVGALRTVLDNIRGSLKLLAEYATGEAPRSGQPRASTRRFYELPAIIQSGSLRVSILPSSDTQEFLDDPEDIWMRMRETLELGIEAATRDRETLAESPSMREQLRVGLRAVYLLSPPAYGSIQSTEITGHLISSRDRVKPVSIDKNTRALLSQWLRADSPEPQFVKDRGIISELDREEATCLLRDSEGNTIRKLVFEEPFFEDVKNAFDTQCEVNVVSGFFRPNEIANLLALRRVPAS